MKPFRIVHFSDIHESAPMTDPSGFFDKRIIGAVHARFARRRLHDPALVPEAVSRILNDPPDVIVFSGDAASCGQASEFELAQNALQPLIESGIPILYSPGNHDLYVKNQACRMACANFIRNLTGGKMNLDGYPYAETIGPLRFAVLNGARPTNPVLSCGFLNQASRQFLQKEWETKTDPLIVVCHFPFRRIRKGLINGMRHQLFGAKEAAAAISAGKIDLALCGHIHTPYFDLDETGRGESSCGSLTRFGAYSLIEYADGFFSHRRISLSDCI